MSAIEDIATERKRQVDAEGWTPEHDDGHKHGEIALAAASYAAHTAPKLDPWIKVGFAGRTQMAGDFNISDLLWPWDLRWWKPKNRRRDLIRAGALIVAEIERIDRAETK